MTIGERIRASICRNSPAIAYRLGIQCPPSEPPVPLTPAEEPEAKHIAGPPQTKHIRRPDRTKSE